MKYILKKQWSILKTTKGGKILPFISLGRGSVLADKKYTKKELENFLNERQIKNYFQTIKDDDTKPKSTKTSKRG
jgi:hypothetical protein